jgi:septal ring factor EnvC (AmiA/AmiB activator)
MKSTLIKQSKENASMKAELASLKQAQAEQQKLLAKLAAYVQNGKNNTPIQKVNVVQH